MSDASHNAFTIDQPWVIAELEPFLELFEEAPVAYHELDADGIVRRVNRAHCELLGYSATETIGKPIWSFTLDEEQDASRRTIARKLARLEPLRTGRRSCVTRDRRVLTVEVHSRLIVAQDGQAIGIRAAMFDITERVAAEAKLAETQKWLTTTLDSMGVAILAVDPLGAVKFMNRAAQDLVEWPAAEAEGRDVADLLCISGITCSADEGVQTLDEVLHRGLLGGLTARTILAGREGTAAAVDMECTPILLDEHRVAGIAIMLRRPQQR